MQHGRDGNILAIGGPFPRCKCLLGPLYGLMATLLLEPFSSYAVKIEVNNFRRFQSCAVSNRG
jgi:hypothetical protein